MDNQWFIVDGIGKQGTATGGDNYFPSANMISDVFLLEGVGHPLSNFSQYTANSILVIYADLSYCNERTQNKAPKYFIQDNLPTNNTLGQWAHNFISKDKIGNPSNILHAYLSNIYEGDDPPERVVVLPGNRLGNQGFGDPYIVIPSAKSDLIQASHSIAPGKDITIILDHNNIIRESGAGLYILEFGKFLDLSTQNVIPDPGFLSLSPIGSGGAVISGGAFKIYNLTNQIEIDIQPDTNTFVNLNASDPTHIFFPTLPIGSQDFAGFEAIFTLENKQSGISCEAREAIRVIQ